MQFILLYWDFVITFIIESDVDLSKYIGPTELGKFALVCFGKQYCLHFNLSMTSVIAIRVIACLFRLFPEITMELNIIIISLFAHLKQWQYRIQVKH